MHGSDQTIKKLERELELAQDHLKRLESEVRPLENTDTREKARIDVKKKELEKAEADLRIVEIKITDKKAEIEHLRGSLHRSQSTLERLRQQLKRAA